MIPAINLAQLKRLEYFINTAVSGSPLLNDYRNQLIANSIDSQILAASRQVQLNANGNSYYAPIRNGYGYDEAITNGAQLQVLLTASKDIIPKKYINLGFKELQLTGDSIRVASKISELDLKKTITGQYITTYGDQLQLNFYDEMLTLLQKEEVILRKLTQRNVYRQVDYLSFLVTLQQQELSRRQQVIQLKNDYANLNYLAGIVDTTISPLEEPRLNIVYNFIADSSSFFLKYSIDSLRLVNNKALINLSYRPQLRLYADGGYQSSLKYVPYKNFGNSFGIQFIVPIYDGGQKKLQYSKIDAAEQTRSRNREYFRTQYLQQLAQLKQQLYAIDELDEPIKLQIKYIETLLDANGKLLETGDIKMTDYILALNNYITARNLVLQNKIARLQIINQLNYWSR